MRVLYMEGRPVYGRVLVDTVHSEVPLAAEDGDFPDLAETQKSALGFLAPKTRS
jgi:hypothetical protein